jgi:hypothetical protein
MAVLATVLVAGAGAAAAPPRTEVLHWSPFDSAARVKPSLTVVPIRGGLCTDIGYTLVGGVGYRCGAGNALFDACWRDGPNATEFVICTNTPWQRKVLRLRSPNLLLYPGVTYQPAARYPWAIELTDGNRCTVVQGAHDAVRTHGRMLVVDYDCERHHVVLLREGLQRGRVWHARAARFVSVARGFRLVGHVRLRRVWFGTLPPPMGRQNELAGAAVAAAKRVVRRTARRPHLGLVWVRLALPRADWAYVIFERESSDRGLFAVLHRAGGIWEDASAYRPYCKKVPAEVRRQLFLRESTRLPFSQRQLAPRGETRCGA